MRCPSCGEEHQDSGRFCVQCGSPLLACARCGHPNPIRAKFCAECGAPLEPAQPVAERRQITVMFCDLVGSTALSSRVDPEELRDLIREHQAHCAETVRRFDGSVVQYLGDGVLVYFGVPHAHEDDACRAGYAALEIVRAMPDLNARWALRVGAEIAVRVGIHTGPVVIGEVGGGGRTETLAIGETPNLAARLQGAARSNSVVASDATHRLISHAFQSRDLGELSLPGVGRSVRAYELVERAEEATRRRRGQGGLESTLVGRSAELATLRDQWRKSCSGAGGIVVLRGEAGIGKSVLVEALKADVTRDGGVVLEGDCSPYYQNSAFFPLTRLLARWSGFASTDAPSDRQQKLASALGSLSLTDAAAQPLIASLLSVPVDPSDRVFKLAAALQRARTLNLLLTIPRALSQQRPVMLVIEDLHWADPSTLELLKIAVTRPEPSPLMMLLTRRPEFSAEWMDHPSVTRVELGGLDLAGAEQLVTQSVGGKALPAEVVRQILQRADGIPLFIEETTRAIVDANVLHDTGERYELAGPLPPTLVPATLQDALMARLDRLDEARRIVQLGAAIGREFGFELLSAVSGDDELTLHDHLERAVSSGLLQQHGVPPRATFVFKHALVQDTAYQSLLRKTRHQYHQRIAEVLEDRFRETAEHRPELLARHHTEGNNAPRAIPYWLKAGTQAIARAAFAEAISHLSNGLRLLEALPASLDRDRQELALQSALGMALQAHRGYAAPEVDRAYTRARAVCQRAGTADELLSVCRGQNVFYIVRADYRVAAQMAEELLSVGEKTASAEHMLEGHLMLGANQIYQARFLESRAHFEQVLALLPPDSGARHAFQYVGHSSAFSRSYLGRTLSFLGNYDQAVEASEQGLAVARTLAIPMSVAQAMGMHTLLYQVRGEIEPAQSWAAQTLAYATEYGLPYWSSLSSIVLGWVQAHQGQLEQGISQLRRGIDQNLSTGAKVGRSWFLVMLADMYRTQGAWEHGFDAVAQALAHAEETEERYYEAEAYRLKGELLKAQGGLAATEAAETCFRRAIAIARHQGARSWELRASTSLARLWHDTARAAEGRQVLADVYESFTEGHEVPDLQEARRMLGELTTQV